MEHTYLGTAFSGQAHSLTLDQRLRHIAVNGKTGYGKSTLLKSVLAQDIARGDGVLLLDPAGTLAEEALAFIPPIRNNQLCYFNIADRDFPVGFNIFADVPPERRSTLAEQIVSAFKSIWLDMWGPQLERLLRASSLALLDTPGTSMVDILRLYFDPDFRAQVLSRCRNPVAVVFFEREFSAWSPEFLDKAISPVLNKLEAFLSHDLIRNILGQSESTLHMEQALARIDAYGQDDGNSLRLEPFRRVPDEAKTLLHSHQILLPCRSEDELLVQPLEKTHAEASLEGFYLLPDGTRRDVQLACSGREA